MSHRWRHNFFLHYIQKRKLLHHATTTQYEVGIKYIFKKCKLISCQPSTLQNHITQTAHKYTPHPPQKKRQNGKIKMFGDKPHKIKIILT
jgi:hypothetical protein